MSGRGGNDIASALIKILEEVLLDHPNTNRIVTWSDSCVPQNRNSIMSFAMADFLKRHPQIDKITMKFSTPGHSAVQEVDNMHSHIEKAMAASEFFSPLSLVRVLLGVSRKQKYNVIQMTHNDFNDYHACAKLFKYKQIPYSDVAQLVFEQCPYTIAYKTSHAQPLSVQVDIRGQLRSTRTLAPTGVFPNPKPLPKQGSISEAKMSDIRSMFKFMPVADRHYYSAIFTK